jgi:putative hydrolase of the HAD superfamily
MSGAQVYRSQPRVVTTAATATRPPAAKTPSFGWRPKGPSPRGLILDLDDTLYPRERFVRSGFAAVAGDLQRRHGLPAGAVFKTLSQAFTSAAAGREFQVVCSEFDLPQDELRTMLRVFRTHTPSLWLPYETAETLRRLRTEGWRLAILTNGLPHVQAGKVAALALAPMVDHVIYADSIVRGGKPAPEAFRAAIDRLDVAVERCVMVGDTPETDIAGGRAAGLRTIRLHRPGVTVTGRDADIVIHRIDMLPAAAPAALETETLDAA